jgi:hypothetical protein
MGEDGADQPVAAPCFRSGFLLSVSCLRLVPRATSCYAVGYSPFEYQYDVGTTLAERVKGARWTIQPTLDPAGTGLASYNVLSGVSCWSKRRGDVCMAVGAYSQTADNQHTLSERLSQ